MPDSVNCLIYHVGSGHVFFTGVGLMMLAITMSLWSSYWFQRAAIPVFMIGVIAVAISSTPVPIWMYPAMVIAGLFWLKNGQLL